MEYHASLMTADGAYHCPVGSIMAIFFRKLLFFGRKKGIQNPWTSYNPFQVDPKTALETQPTIPKPYFEAWINIVIVRVTSNFCCVSPGTLLSPDFG